jgi:hypothetical protein
MMKTKFCNLIILSPNDPQIWRIHISRQAMIILIVAFLLSFCVTVAVNSAFVPEKLSSAEHLRLQTENQSLEVANKNAQIQTAKVEAEIRRLETLSYRISTLIEAD